MLIWMHPGPPGELNASVGAPPKHGGRQLGGAVVKLMLSMKATLETALSPSFQQMTLRYSQPDSGGRTPTKFWGPGGEISVANWKKSVQLAVLSWLSA